MGFRVLGGRTPTLGWGPIEAAVRAPDQVRSLAPIVRVAKRLVWGLVAGHCRRRVGCAMRGEVPGEVPGTAG